VESSAPSCKASRKAVIISPVSRALVGPVQRNAKHTTGRAIFIDIDFQRNKPYCTLP